MSDIRILPRLLAALLSAALLGTTPTLHAALFIVDTNVNDLSDFIPGDGLCQWSTIVPVGQRCTLRAAITEANALPGTDTIIIPEGMTITLVQSIRGEDGGLSGDLDITDSLVLGSFASGGTRPIIDAAGLDRVLDIPVGGAGITVRIANLQLRNGHATAANGFSGGCINAGSIGRLELWNLDMRSCRANQGGAVWSDANQIELLDSEVRNNLALDLGFTNADAAGMYVRADGSILIERSTFADNAVSVAATSVRAGVWIDSSAALARIRNSTFSANSPVNIRLYSTDFELNNVTITDAINTGLHAGWFNGGSSRISNSIIAGNAVDCALSVTSGVLATNHNYTMDGDSSCALGFGAGNLLGQNPQLLPLGANGGPTRTHLPALASPAIDTGFPGSTGTAACEDTDQRGVIRPATPGPGFPRCDMGAVEVSDRIFGNGFENIVG